MSKIIFFAPLAFLVAGSINTAAAIDGTINFKAVISSAACSVNSVADTSATEGVVDFGTVSNATFGTAGKKTVAVPFSIELTDCAVSAAPTITYEGTSVTTSGYNELYESGLSGLGIRIEDADNIGSYYSSGVAADNVGLSKLTTGVTSTSANFNAYLVDYIGSSTYDGSIDTDVTFTMNYN